MRGFRKSQAMRKRAIAFVLGVLVVGIYFHDWKKQLDLLSNSAYLGETLDKQMEIPAAINNTLNVIGGVDSSQLFDPENIPSFMMDYFVWHGQQLQQMREDARMSRKNGNDSEEDDAYLSNYRFLVLRCAATKRNGKVVRDRCGGLADRMGSFPLFIWYAAKTNRILFFRWAKDRPAPLETFVLPRNFWNWTFPDDLSRKIEKLEDSNTVDENYSRVYYGGIEAKKIYGKCHDKNVWMVEGYDHTKGQLQYLSFVKATLVDLYETPGKMKEFPLIKNLHARDAYYTNFYHDLFHATFQPSTGVQERLDRFFYVPENTTLSQSKSWLPVPLQRNQYAMAQYRAQFPTEQFRVTGNETILREASYRVVECAKSRVAKSKEVSTIYVTSDTARFVEAVKARYQHENAKPPEGGTDSTKAYKVWTYLDLQTYDPDATGGNEDSIAMKTKPAITLAEDPVHVNFVSPDNVAAVNDVFVDLFLFSYSNCVVRGPGGFGMMGSFVSYRASCGAEYSVDYENFQQCEPFDS